MKHYSAAITVMTLALLRQCRIHSHRLEAGSVTWGNAGGAYVCGLKGEEPCSGPVASNDFYPLSPPTLRNEVTKPLMTPSIWHDILLHVPGLCDTVPTGCVNYSRWATPLFGSELHPILPPTCCFLDAIGAESVGCTGREVSSQGTETRAEPKPHPVLQVPLLPGQDQGYPTGVHGRQGLPPTSSSQGGLSVCTHASSKGKGS